jgi:transcriptional regulator with XRE-family HTH domain
LVAHDSGGVGDRLRTARRSAGLTQKQLADDLGVESVTVSRWERGVTTPSLPRLRRVAELTGTTTSDLVRAPDAATSHAVELAASGKSSPRRVRSSTVLLGRSIS